MPALADVAPLVDAYMNDNARLYLDMLDDGSSNQFYSPTGAVGLSQYLSDMRHEDFPFPDSYNELEELVIELEETIYDTNKHLFDVGILQLGGGDKYILTQDPDPEYPEFHESEEVYEDDVWIEDSDVIPSAYWSGMDKIEGLVAEVQDKWWEVAEELEEIAQGM